MVTTQSRTHAHLHIHKQVRTSCLFDCDTRKNHLESEVRRNSTWNQWCQMNFNIHTNIHFILLPFCNPVAQQYYYFNLILIKPHKINYNKIICGLVWGWMQRLQLAGRVVNVHISVLFTISLTAYTKHLVRVNFNSVRFSYGSITITDTWTRQHN